jgi:predicted lysophospholipase L1 biosynthesis ABC-type transport system permease subunit
MLAVLDVFIGLTFVYGMFSLLVSSATELVMTMISQRGRTLWRAISGMMPGDDLKSLLLKHPLIQGLGAADKNPADSGLLGRLWLRMTTSALDDGRRASFPSYLPSGVFVDTLMHLLRTGSIRAGEARRDDDLVALISDVKNAKLRSTLEALHDSAADTGVAFRTRLQQWYDETMERASGWYKRVAQLALLITGFVLAVSCNVDSIRIVTALSSSSELRQGLVAKATEYLKAKPTTAPAESKEVDQVLKSQVAKYQAADADLDSLGIPIRWGAEAKEYVKHHKLQALMGWLLSAMAAAMGANYWFSLLGKLLKMRIAGVKPETPPAPVSVPPATAVPAATVFAVQTAIPPAGMGLHLEPADHEPSVGSSE